MVKCVSDMLNLLCGKSCWIVDNCCVQRGEVCLVGSVDEGHEVYIRAK